MAFECDTYTQLERGPNSDVLYGIDFERKRLVHTTSDAIDNDRVTYYDRWLELVQTYSQLKQLIKKGHRYYVLKGEKSSVRFAIDTSLKSDIKAQHFWCLDCTVDKDLDIEMALSTQRRETFFRPHGLVLVRLKDDQHVYKRGASWSDLSRLGQRQLEALDADLEDYYTWLLDAFPGQLKRLEVKLTEPSQAAGTKMRLLLANYEVKYDDLSGHAAKLQGWKEPWDRYKDRAAEPQARIRALLKNRVYIAEKTEKFNTCITAVWTLEELMVWRKRWTR
ncbi:hypothetical protein N0V86_003101 [Didymella sp. IMI 355093]|nr:hypothetical protein N0V86_003101 [Didymella sp. IMI 355093]